MSSAAPGEGPVVERTVEAGAGDVELSVVIEGAAAPLTVQVLGPSGTLLAAGEPLEISVARTVRRDRAASDRAAPTAARSR